jgi:hypothetical protein
MSASSSIGVTKRWMPNSALNAEEQSAVNDLLMMAIGGSDGLRGPILLETCQHSLRQGANPDVRCKLNYMPNDGTVDEDVILSSYYRTAALVKDNDFVVPLIFAVRRCWNQQTQTVDVSQPIAIIKMLLDAGANPNVRCTFLTCNISPSRFKWNLFRKSSALDVAVLMTDWIANCGFGRSATGGFGRSAAADMRSVIELLQKAVSDSSIVAQID